jgi:phage I-like protein
MKNIFALLGVSTEEEAIERLTAFNAFATDIKVACNAKTLDEALTRMNSVTALARQVEAVTGKTGGEAAAIVTTWKSSAADADKAREELATLKKQGVDAQASGLIDAAVACGQLEPAKREDFESLYSGFGLPALTAALNALPKGARPADVSPRQPTVSSTSSTNITDADRAVAKATGKTVEQIAEGKKLWAAHSEGKKAYLPIRTA